VHHVIDPASAGGPAALAQQLVQLMSGELVGRCQQAWEINKSLYPEHWRSLDETLRAVEAGQGGLPEVGAVVAFALNGVPVAEFMLDDLGRISSEVNKSMLLAILSLLWHRIDSLDARVLGSYVRGGPGSMTSSLNEVAPKVYGADETIDDVSSVIRGAARIANAIGRRQCADAFDIAQRYVAGDPPIAAVRRLRRGGRNGR
jgi:hypothetical protein